MVMVVEVTAAAGGGRVVYDCVESDREGCGHVAHAHAVCGRVVYDRVVYAHVVCGHEHTIDHNNHHTLHHSRNPHCCTSPNYRSTNHCLNCNLSTQLDMCSSTMRHPRW